MNLNKKEDSHLNLIQFVKDRPDMILDIQLI